MLPGRSGEGNLKNLFSGIYNNKRVFLTGHTGFKGSWMALWLKSLGAEVYGYSLPPIYSPAHYNLTNLDIAETLGDIRDYQNLNKAISEFKPDMVIHMAAQPLVRLSYREPLETFETNVMGTANILNACRTVESVKAIVNITTDKCYENREWVWGYREIDPMGGHDPYSASKGCAELVASSFRNSFFNIEKYGKDHHVLLSSVRAGNVIGGGDWSDDRLIPDIMKAVSKNEEVIIRSPKSTRPWQHVLDPLSGYLQIGQKLLEGNTDFAEAWNFGPADEGSITVLEVVQNIKKSWDKVKYRIESSGDNLHEANLLKLDCSKAHMRLKWKSVWDSSKTFEATTNWYKEYYENKRIISEQQLGSFIKDAVNVGHSWTL
ncbi:MAG: CDP-glucose 4,6-dehydratase [Spirochaetae bacterium HGW-Spirochaetae-5]|nr:MAG: CDP-glucose 4,6-dehydratase [Spirochaetae bacterium HGW-Spirochaetae-5]